MTRCRILGRILEQKKDIREKTKEIWIIIYYNLVDYILIWSSFNKWMCYHLVDNSGGMLIY